MESFGRLAVIISADASEVAGWAARGTGLVRCWIVSMPVREISLQSCASMERRKRACIVSLCLARAKPLFVFVWSNPISESRSRVVMTFSSLPHRRSPPLVHTKPRDTFVMLTVKRTKVPRSPDSGRHAKNAGEGRIRGNLLISNDSGWRLGTSLLDCGRIIFMDGEIGRDMMGTM